MLWITILLFVMQGAVQDDASDPMQQFRHAWASGSIEEVKEYGQSALDAMQAAECAVSPMAASVMFHIAVADQACKCDDLAGYFFWAALRVDERVGGLTSIQREIADQFATEPGLKRNHDRVFAHSPYVDSRIEAQGVCSSLQLESLNEPDTGAGDVAFIYTRHRTRSTHAIYQTDPLFSYPSGEGPAMAEAVLGYRHASQSRRGISFFSFTPCSLLSTVELGQDEVCRSDWLEGEVSAP